MLKRVVLIVLCGAAALSTGCASLRATHLAHLGTVTGPRPEALMALSPAQRQEAYDQGRLTWDGDRIQVGQDSLGRASAQAYLRAQGAPDLAAAMAKALPAYIPWRSEHAHGGGLSKVDLGEASWLNGVNGDAAEALAVAAAAVSLAGAGGASAYVATDSLLRGIGSELNPSPCLEDVLEAYNQRLAYALGLDAKDGSLVTCMPRWSGVSGREHGRASRLVRGGMAAGLGAMVVATSAAWIELADQRPLPTWTAVTFGAGFGGLLAFWAMGWSYAW